MPEWDWVLASEIETAPRAVMAYRHGAEDARYSRRRTGPALWGDFTTIRVRHFRRLGIPLPEWIVGGLPCQAFSIAGLRQSLDDARGNLTLEFLHLVHSLRRAGSLKGILFENVPGILSTPDNAFGCFLAGLVGADDALRSPFERGRWPDEGMVEGPRARAAWRIRDAQYDGLAQRRERVFVVASFVEEIDPAAILFERLGLHGNPPPSREAGEGLTHPVAPCLTSSGRGVERTGEIRGQDPVVAVIDNGAAGRLRQPAVGVDLQNIAATGDVVGTIDTGMARGNRGYGVLEPVAFGGGNQSGQLKPSTALTTKDRCDFDSQTFIVHGTQDPCVSESTAFALGRNNGGENVIAFSAKDYGGDATVNLSPTLRSMGHADSHANGGGQIGVCYGLTTEQTPKFNEDCALTLTKQSPSGGGQPQAVAYAMCFDDPRRFNGPHGGFIHGDLHPTLESTNPKQCVAYSVALRGREGGAQFEGPHDTANIRAASGGSSRSYVAEQWAVRRLMPLECERLQGFDDGFTAIPYRKRKIPADEVEQSAIGGARVWQEDGQWFTDCMADGPRYKMIGNSMARPVIRWILQQVDSTPSSKGPQHD